MVAISPDKSRAYTANIPDGTVSVIDLAAGRKLRAIAVGGDPEGTALAKGGRELWVGDLPGARVRALDTARFDRRAAVQPGPTTRRGAGRPDRRGVGTSTLGSSRLTVRAAA